MGERKAIDARASALMLFICMILGMQQVALKFVATDISPIMQIALRSGLSALLVLPLIQLPQGERLFAKAYLKPGCLLAFLFAGEFVFVAEALKYTSAAHTVMLLYTAPIFTALGLHLKIPAERLSKVQWLGIVVAFMGIVVTFLRQDNSMSASHHHELFGDLLALLAGVFWAMTTIALRLSQLSDVHPSQTLFYQLFGSFLLLLPLAFLTGQSHIHWTALAIGGLVFQTVMVSFVSLMLWFWLLRHYLASRLGVFSFLTPLFGMLFGMIALNERIELNFIIGTIMVMFGVAIVSIRGWVKQPVKAES